jgi:hypothetical protein
MLPNCDCLPNSQAGGAEQNIVLERGMLTAVSSIKPVNQCNKFSVFIAFVILSPIPFPLTHFGQNWYPRCEGRASTGPASKLRRPKRVSGETLNLLC